MKLHHTMDDPDAMFCLCGACDETAGDEDWPDYCWHCAEAGCPDAHDCERLPIFYEPDFD